MIPANARGFWPHRIDPSDRFRYRVSVSIGGHFPDRFLPLLDVFFCGEIENGRVLYEYQDAKREGMYANAVFWGLAPFEYKDECVVEQIESVFLSGGGDINGTRIRVLAAPGASFAIWREDFNSSTPDKFFKREVLPSWR